MSELDEKGIERAYATIEGFAGSTHVLVKGAIEAYLTEPPKWPSDESVKALADAIDDFPNEAVRQAARVTLLADPIISAAAELVHSYDGNSNLGPLGLVGKVA